MDFSIPDRAEEILPRIRQILDEQVQPLEPIAKREGFRAILPALGEVRKHVQAEGLWAPQMPTEVGGMGLSLVEHALTSEVLGRSPYGHYAFGCQAPDAGNMEILHKYGTPEQKKRFFAPLVAGKIRSCFSMTEPDTAGSNPTQLACMARKDGDDYIINGKKWFTSSADGASFAVVMAVTNPENPRPHERASQILVPTDTPGFRLVRNLPIFGDPGEDYMSHSEVHYENCRVPQSFLLGEEGTGFQIAQERLGPGRIHHCMRWMGICERSFELMCERALTRQIDEQETLSDKQIIQCWISEARARIDAARLMVLRTAWKIEQSDFSSSREEISLIKFFCADVLMETLDRAIQVHGALGITDDVPLAHFYAHERGSRIYDGADEVHKLAAARRILRKFRA